MRSVRTQLGRALQVGDQCIEEALEKQVDDLDARNADADERIERLTQILKAFDRARFGRRSEKLAAASVDDAQHAFVFEEIETGIAAIRGERSADGVGLEVPGHECLDFRYGPALSDAGQGLGEPVKRIAVVHLGCLQEGGDRRPGASTTLAAGE